MALEELDSFLSGCDANALTSLARANTPEEAWNVALLYRAYIQFIGEAKAAVSFGAVANDNIKGGNDRGGRRANK